MPKHWRRESVLEKRVERERRASETSNKLRSNGRRPIARVARHANRNGEGRALLGGVGVFQIFFSFLFGGARMGNHQHKYCWGTQQVLISFVVARKG